MPAAGVVVAGVVVAGVVVAGLVAGVVLAGAEVELAGVEAAGVVTAAEVVGGAEVVAVPPLQAVITKTLIKRITKRTKNFFTLSSYIFIKSNEPSLFIMGLVVLSRILTHLVPNLPNFIWGNY